MRLFCQRVSGSSSLLLTHHFLNAPQVFQVNSHSFVNVSFLLMRLLGNASVCQMVRIKHTAKKSNGGSVPHVILNFARATGTLGVEHQRRQALTASKATTVGGGDVEKRNACHKALSSTKATLPMAGGHNELPPDLETTVLQEDISFRCVCCHIKMDQPGTYFGFYHTNSAPVLDRFLPINVSSSPMEFVHMFLKSYYTGGGLTYLDVIYDIGTDEKLAPYCNQVCKMIRGLKNSFAWERVVIGMSTHTDEDYGDPFIEYEDTKEYHSTGVNDFLEIILQPWQGIINCAQESYLWMLCCGSLVNNKDSFHGLQEAVVRHKFTGTIAFSAPCFQPSFALLTCSRFAWANLEVHPWGNHLPIQCSGCDWANSWRSAYVKGSKDKSYIFECKNDSCNAILDEHKIAYVSAKGNVTKRATILKSIKDTIVQSDESKDPSTMLPDKNLHKAIRTYYLWFLEDDEDCDDEQKIIEGGPKLVTGPGIVTVDMVRDCQDDKPLDAAAFKSEFLPFDVAQKLFKEEIGEYDKKHHDTSDLRFIGTRTKLVRSWYNALSPSVLEELRLVADKWNQEGPHSDAKDRYHSRHQKKIMEDFIKMAGRTMGLHVIILAAHDRGEGKMPGTTIWESCPRKAKKTFTLSSKENKKWAGESQDQLADWLNEAEYTEDHEDGSDEDDEKGPDLTVQVNDEGYPCLPTGFESLILKNQQKVVWQRLSQTTLGLQSHGVISPKIQTITLTWTVFLGMSSSRILLTCKRKPSA
ncbi:hypothetical protein EV702DRAFT_1045535 [Suillus placidus]|uniref:Uncharacterized protein n=1 Tax=Suillus placidus TaxID=48579 RepID=A0A9P6ZUR0_9AGAM|nr:hypothetical protein EV702DRAFT_1045535 [Suillus placidus]